MNKIAFYNILSTILLQGISFFTAPIFSRIMGTTNYGIFSMYLTWVNVVTTVFCLQTNSTLTIAKRRFPEEEFSYQSSVLFLGFISHVLFSALTIILSIPLSTIIDIDYMFLLFILLNGFGQYAINFLNGKLTYEFKAKYNVVLSFGYTLSSVLIALILIYILPANINYYSRIIANTLCSFTIGIGVLIYFYKNGKTIYSKKYWMYCLPLSIPIVFHSLSSIILNQSDKIMIQLFIDSSSLGIYSLALNFSNIMNIIWSSLNNSWVPFYYEFSRKNENDKMIYHAKNYIELYTILTLGFILLSPEVYHLFAGKEFWIGTNLIPIFVIGIYMIFMYSFEVNYEFFYEKTKNVALATIISAIINIILNFFLIHTMGTWGATLATAIAHCIQFLIHYFFAKNINAKVTFPFEIKLFIPSLIAIGCATFLFYLIPSSLWYIRWGIGAALGVYLLYKLVKRKSIF